MEYNHIIHMQFTGPYTENMSYQENILPRYQKTNDNIVEMWTIDSEIHEGQIIKVPSIKKVMADGVVLRRFPVKKIINYFLSEKLRYIEGIYEELKKENPDFIMIHDVQSHTLLQIVKYVRECTDVKVVVDCHTDYYNSARNWVSKNVLHRIIYKYYAKKIEPYSSSFFGTLPMRIDFLVNVYKIDHKKCSLLVMGADDNLVIKATNKEAINILKESYGIGKDDFLIVTGGKMNEYRANEVINLMKAVCNLKEEHVKLIIFGYIDERYRENFKILCDGIRIIYVGWLNTEDTYRYMALADLIIFPGLHSVMWEQAVALGIPCIFRDLDGFHHVDLNGNAIFIKNPTKEKLQKEIENLFLDKDKYKKMVICAKEKEKEMFFYKNIAHRCLQEA